MIPLTFKRSVARYIGKNLELCKDAFEEGRKQGQLLVSAEKAKQQQDNTVAEPTEKTVESNQYAYDKATNPV